MSKSQRIFAQAGVLPINNPFKDVFGDSVQKRKQLISKVRSLRSKRDALRGEYGDKAKATNLSLEINKLQAEINQLNTRLGIEVKVSLELTKHRNSQLTGRANHPGGIKRGELYIIGTETPTTKSQFGSFTKPSKPEPLGDDNLKG